MLEDFYVGGSGRSGCIGGDAGSNVMAPCQFGRSRSSPLRMGETDGVARISDPRFHSPWGLAFSGKSLLVTNGDLEPGTNPDAWKIFKVYVGETGLPLNRPKT